MATTRIYLIEVAGKQRLVDAGRAGSALMHVANDIAQVRVASQHDLVAAIGKGIKVEKAGESQQQELPGQT